MRIPEPTKLRDWLKKHMEYNEGILRDIDGWTNINPQNPVRKVFEEIEERAKKELERDKELLEILEKNY